MMPLIGGGCFKGQGQGAGGPNKRGGRLSSRSKAAPFIIFEFTGIVTRFFLCATAQLPEMRHRRGDF